eukprot:c8646_g1_i2.p1 GENE.c8646_g1_i2~~c8646_g1_i2.p1  ORF type:complete len:504 (+),score=102.80 c8646_g1_i2:165-1514(+)
MEEAEVTAFESFCYDPVGASPDEIDRGDLMDLVPHYTRDFSEALTDNEGPDDAIDLRLSCWNCGSMEHSLKTCKRPRNYEVIRENRSKFLSQTGSQLSTKRYYVEKHEEANNFTPGLISGNLAEALGIGQLDPPPYYPAMLRYGYPPAYTRLPRDNSDGDLDDEDTELEIHGTEESGDGLHKALNARSSMSSDTILALSERMKAHLARFADRQAGQGNPTASEHSRSQQKTLGSAVAAKTLEQIESKEMIVDGTVHLHAYPGINSPIPEGADEKRWLEALKAPPTATELRQRKVELEQLAAHDVQRQMQQEWEAQFFKEQELQRYLQQMLYEEQQRVYSYAALQQQQQQYQQQQYQQYQHVPLQGSPWYTPLSGLRHEMWSEPGFIGVVPQQHYHAPPVPAPSPRPPPPPSYPAVTPQPMNLERFSQLTDRASYWADKARMWCDEMRDK